MKPSTEQLLQKALRAITAAETLTRSGDTEFTIGRAYYAMFYIAEALLNEKDLQFSKHGGVHGAFGEHFVKTSLFEPRYHRWLLAAFNRRITGDYGIDAVFTNQEAQEAIQQAREFYQAARTFFSPS
jgi:uncharacterized protein (UPF0332 family)